MIPIDLEFPNRIEMNRTAITEHRVINRSELDQDFELDPTEKIDKIDQFEDITQEAMEAKLPIVARQFLLGIKERMQRCFEILRENRAKKIAQAVKLKNRKIKKREYNIGDLVLCNHSKIRAGTSQGLAPRYCGPFKVIGKNINSCDYLIKNMSKPKSRPKTVHINNLKTYFERGREVEKSSSSEDEGESELESEDDQIRSSQSTSKHQGQKKSSEKPKRAYRKNPNCARWRKNNESPSSSSDEAPEIDDIQREVISSNSSDIIVAKPKRKYTKIKEVDQQPKVTRAGRKSAPPKRLGAE